MRPLGAMNAEGRCQAFELVFHILAHFETFPMYALNVQTFGGAGEGVICSRSGRGGVNSISHNMPTPKNKKRCRPKLKSSITIPPRAL